jgi:hypothetical protein
MAKTPFARARRPDPTPGEPIRRETVETLPSHPSEPLKAVNKEQ